MILEVGRVVPGQQFEMQELAHARSLISRGLATEILEPPISTYETKVIVPQPPAVPVVAAPPFRDLYMPDQSEPSEVLTYSDPVLSSADVPKQGVVDPPRRKRGRPKKHL